MDENMNSTQVCQQSPCYYLTFRTENPEFDLCNTHTVQALRASFKYCLQRRPFIVDAVCLLPDHIHCVWSLPEGDSDHVMRWRLISSYLMRHHRWPSPSWLENYQVRTITDVEAKAIAIDYLHMNPVKHGLCAHPSDWPWSSYHRYAEKGLYETGWPEILPVDFDKDIANFLTRR